MIRIGARVTMQGAVRKDTTLKYDPIYFVRTRTTAGRWRCSYIDNPKTIIVLVAIPYKGLTSLLRGIISLTSLIRVLLFLKRGDFEYNRSYSWGYSVRKKSGVTYIRRCVSVAQALRTSGHPALQYRYYG